MNELVMITVDEDGSEVESPKWCLVDSAKGDPVTFCDGQFFGEGQGCAEFKLKEVKRGGITCPHCLKKIKAIKAVRL